MKKFFNIINCQSFLRLITNDENSIDVSRNRLYVLVILYSLGFGIIGIRLLSIVLTPDSYIYPHNNNDSQIIVHRGNIVDRNDVLLAVNLSVASLYANPRIILDHKEAADKLIKIFPDLNYRQLLTDISSDKAFVWIKRNLTPKEQFAVNNLGLPGLSFERGEKRVYPHGRLLSHALGFVGVDGQGQAGIEKYFDKKLRGDLEHGDLYPQSLKLSLDVRVQNIVHEELTNSAKEFDAIGAVGIVMDVTNGEILSSVSLPDFDPHNPAQASEEQLFNRFSMGLYEPGSTFKTYTLAMALDSNIIAINDVYDVSAPLKAARFNINDFRPKGHAALSVPEIFMHSSNIGTAKIGIDVGRQKQKQFLRSLGLLDNLEEAEINEKAHPLYPQDNRWSDISMMTISYGHGIAVTPLHITKSMSAMVNGGVLHPASFVKKDGSEPFESVRVIKESTSEQIRKLLRLVVEQGHGKKAHVQGYLVGGKTGTAEKVKRGGYNKNNRLSSFVAAFPIDNPKYLVLVMLDEPKGTAATAGYATGGITAAPAVGRIISRLGTLYGMKLTNEDDPAIKQRLYLDYKPAINDEHSSF